MSDVLDTLSEGNGSWLPLTEYSVRSGVSTSTIRRKIKSNTIRHRLENGKYMIFYIPGRDTMPRIVMQETEVAEPQVHTTMPTARPKPPPPKVIEPMGTEPKVREVRQEESVAVPLMEKAVQMVSDAFEHSLNEKDKRIHLLERRNSELVERLDELKTLVQVLEEKYQVRY